MTSFVRAQISLPTSTDAANPASSGVRTIPELVEHNAKHNPSYPFSFQAQKIDGSVSLLRVSHLQLRNAILRCQKWIQEEVKEAKLPLQSENGHIIKCQPIALLVESDVGLMIHLIALLGLGVPALLLSNRLNPEAINQLLKTTGSKAMLVSPRLYKTYRASVESTSLDDFPVKFYERRPYEFFTSQQESGKITESICKPFYHTDETDRQVIILHSSGTTGLPKPIFQSHEFLLGFAAAHQFSDPKDAESCNVSTLPLYHGFGMLAPCLSMSIGLTLCLPVTSISPGATIIELLALTKARSLMTVPSILEDISLHEAGIKALLPLQFVAFGGGLLNPLVGEKLDKAGVRLLNHFGATEVGAIAPIWALDKSDYDYHFFRLRKDFKFKVVPLESAESEKETSKLITYPFGWGEPFEINDQLIRNPQNPTDFGVLGRTDDVIALATGEKVLPNIMEALISESEICKTAIAVGQGQFEIGVLIEPSKSIAKDEEENFRDQIWNIVRKANEKVDTHGAVTSRDAIIIAKDKQIPRSDKGSVMRQEVYKLFEEEISQMYKNLETSTNGAGVSLDWEDLEDGIRALIQDHLNWKIPKEDWTNANDIFELGMDSLQALQLRRLILTSISDTNGESLSKRIPREFVYFNPTVSKMAAALRGGEFVSVEDDTEHLVSEYSVKQTPKERPEGDVILLTGSTGSLGSHLLERLANMQRVSRVVCLNRSNTAHAPEEASAENRQRVALEAKGITLFDSTWDKIEFLQGDLAEPYFGLDQAKYLFLTRRVTHILHNAWPMDFNMRVSSFTPQFAVLRSLLQLSKDCYANRPTIRPKFLFISSIAVVGKYPQVHHKPIVPEISMEDDRCTDDFGYAQAKLVCEKMVQEAAGSEIDARIVRVGQMSGARKKGVWNTREHFPALVRSSLLVKALPKLRGTLSWLPVDSAAESVVDFLFTPPETCPSCCTSNPIYHLENPTRQAWADVIDILASELSIKDIIPYAEWLARVQGVSDDAIEVNPAKKMAGFFERDFEHMASGQVVMETVEARKRSKYLSECGEVGEDVIRAYVKGWREVGFLEVA